MFASQQVKIPICRTVLLADLPAEDDRFGPHGDVARGMSDIVRTELGGKSIGLTSAPG
jgi:hypothetical protein